MKQSILLFICFYPLLLIGQAERVYSIAIQKNSKSYYVDQTKLWEAEVKKQNEPDAWVNYYTAARMSNLLTPGHDKPFDTKKLIQEMEQKIPKTFEYHHIKSWELGHTQEGWEHAQEAYKINPDRYECYDNFVLHYDKKRDLKNRAKFNQKWYDSGECSEGMLRWNYNMLMSVAPNGILITHGDGDTHPSWMLQDVHNIRKDILIANFYLLTMDDYRMAVFNELGIPDLEDGKKLLRLPADEAYRLLAKHLNKHSKRPVYFGMAIRRDVADLLSDSLYIEGLAFRYHAKAYDNIPQLITNYENRFIKDHFKINFNKDVSESVLKHINFNYIPGLMLVYQYYQEQGEKAKAKEVKALCLQIGKKANREDVILSQLMKYE